MATPSAAAAPGALSGLQERAAAAFPALCCESLDGWWLRHTDGNAWWSASVLPHRDAGPTQLPGRIRAVEDFYAGHRAPARFQITPSVAPAGLDGALADRGYRVDSPMSLQSAATATVAGRLPVGGQGVRLADRPTDDWFTTWLSVHGHGGRPQAEWDMLARVRHPSGYASVERAGRVVAVGRAVAQDGWAGVFGMATLPPWRGTGAAGQVLAGLAGWAAGHGATRVYLQVEPDNVAARRLYGRAGFVELCRYHYRTSTRSRQC